MTKTKTKTEITPGPDDYKVQKLRGIWRIVTHGGQAHMDEIVACGLALHYGKDVAIRRRQPTEEDLESPHVLVLDVGEQYEPALLNFDHHQLLDDNDPDGDLPDCAASLFARWLGIHDVLARRPWYSALRIMDVRGPFAWSKGVGIQGSPFPVIAQIAFVGGALRWRFERATMIHPQDELITTIKVLVGAMVGEAEEFGAQIDEAKADAKLVSLGGDAVALFCPDPTPSPVTTAMRDELVSAGRDVPMLIAPSPRDGESWMLYRYDDDPRVDLFVLEDHDGVVYADHRGFIAKLTDAREWSWDEITELAQAAFADDGDDENDDDG